MLIRKDVLQNWLEKMTLRSIGGLILKSIFLKEERMIQRNGPIMLDWYYLDGQMIRGEMARIAGSDT